MQMEATRRELFAALRTNARTPRLTGATSMVPVTITVSNIELPKRFVSMARPSVLGTRPPVSDRTRTS